MMTVSKLECFRAISSYRPSPGKEEL